jgi:hypothetical protein
MNEVVIVGIMQCFPAKVVRVPSSYWNLYCHLLISLQHKMWGRDVFTSPENVGVCSFHVSRKCGSVMFSSIQKMWKCDFFKYPENVGV